MSEHQNQDPFENVESNIGACLNAYDQDKNELFNYIKDVVHNGFDAYDITEASALITITSRSFMRTASALRESSTDIDEAKSALIQFWKADDEERVTEFRNLLGTEAHQYIDDEEVATIIDELYEESSSVTELDEKLMDRYKQYLSTDTNILVGQVKARTEVPADDHLFEQAPAIQELITEFEKIAYSCSEDFKNGYEDAYSLSTSTTDIGGDLTTKFTFDADRFRTFDEDEIGQITQQYSVNTSVKYFYDGFDSLPGYVRDSLRELANDEETHFDIADFTEDTSLYTVEFTYSLTARDSGSFWYYYDFGLYLDDQELPIPDTRGESMDDTDEDIQRSEPSDEEQQLLDSIFSNEELADLTAISEEVAQEEPELDMIELFRKNIADISSATIEQHIARARGLAKTFQKFQKH